MSNLTIKIWRGTESGHFQHYEVKKRANQTVLDVLTEIQRRQDSSLSYRFSCRVGVCGSCAMTVNGKARWTCRTHVSSLKGNEITIEPLRHMPKIKDLVVDMSGFFDKWGKVGSNFASTANRHKAPLKVNPESPDRREADSAIECINCGVCYSSCDVVGWNEEYLGPAALNRAWSLVKDARHSDKAETLALASGAGGCGNCHTQGNCMSACPIGLSPTRSIAGLKRMSLTALLRGTND